VKGQDFFVLAIHSIVKKLKIRLAALYNALSLSPKTAAEECRSLTDSSEGPQKRQKPLSKTFDS
jgi:hypothetical protein